MELILERKIFTDNSTIGELSIDGAFNCFILEDKVRENEPKVFGKTAIPYGKYKVIVTKSARFSKLAGHDVYLPLLLKVEGYEGVRIHTGNRPEDTEGCLLPGTAYETDKVLNSRTAFVKLNELINDTLKKGEEVWITIKKTNL
nr:DUF5675 family protein [uncultured Flavobacterium sp.]